MLLIPLLAIAPPSDGLPVTSRRTMDWSRLRGAAVTTAGLLDIYVNCRGGQQLSLSPHRCARDAPVAFPAGQSTAPELKKNPVGHGINAGRSGPPLHQKDF